jgi:hypothetical protein
MIGFDGISRIRSGVTLCMVADVLGCAQSPATAARSSASGPPSRLLYLAVRHLDDYRGPSVGIRSLGWKQAMQAFTSYLDGGVLIP